MFEPSNPRSGMRMSFNERELLTLSFSSGRHYCAGCTSHTRIRKISRSHNRISNYISPLQTKADMQKTNSKRVSNPMQITPASAWFAEWPSESGIAVLFDRPLLGFFCIKEYLDFVYGLQRSHGTQPVSVVSISPLYVNEISEKFRMARSR